MKIQQSIPTIQPMTPDEYSHGGKHLDITYSFAESPFGGIIIASTSQGVCYLGFADDEHIGLTHVQKNFPHANYKKSIDDLQGQALNVFHGNKNEPAAIKLHLKGTDFQLKVWQALLAIPLGGRSTYGAIAQQINHSKAFRAVGTAVGANPIAFLIPCHRVFPSSGALGNYHWGPARKSAMLAWEVVQAN